MTTRLISPVTDNIDKQRTYREQMGRYKRAMQEGFYFEAMLISYAAIEDRLLSMLYHMAFRKNRKTLDPLKTTKSYYLQIVETYKAYDENTSLGLKSITSKMKIIRCSLKWVATTTDDYAQNKFLRVLKKQFEGMDIDGLLAALDGIAAWCKYRNEVIHSLLNKNIDSLEQELAEKASEGMQYARLLDAQERILKKGNCIRRSVNAPRE